MGRDVSVVEQADETKPADFRCVAAEEALFVSAVEVSGVVAAGAGVETGAVQVGHAIVRRERMRFLPGELLLPAAEDPMNSSQLMPSGRATSNARLERSLPARATANAATWRARQPAGLSGFLLPEPAGAQGSLRKEVFRRRHQMMPRPRVRKASRIFRRVRRRRDQRGRVKTADGPVDTPGPSGRRGSHRPTVRLDAHPHLRCSPTPRSRRWWRCSCFCCAMSPPASPLGAVRLIASFGVQLAQESAIVDAHPLLDEASPVVEAEDIDQVEHDAFAVGRQRADR